MQKGTWDALDTKFDVSDAHNELYIMKLFHDYKMDDEHFVFEHAYEIHSIAKEIEQFTCVPLRLLPHCLLFVVSDPSPFPVC